MTIYDVQYSPLVDRQIRAHIQYLRDCGVAEYVIAGWAARLYKAINSLENLPKRCPVSASYSRKFECEVRKMVFENYLIFYDFNEVKKCVRILAFIRSTQQDL